MAPSILGSALSDTLWQAEQTPWGMSASAVSQAVPALYNPMASNSRNFWMTLGGGILSTVLAGLGRNQADERNAELYSGFRALQLAETEPERQAIVKQYPRLTNAAFALDQQQIDLSNQIRLERAKRQAEIQKEEAMIDIDARKEGAKTKERLAAEEGAGGFNAPSEKALDTLRKEVLGLPEVKTLPAVERASKVILKALQDPSAVSDQELVRYSILLIEPGMAVREGEQAAVASSQSIPEAWRGMLNKSLTGGTALDEGVREGLKRLAQRAYQGSYDQYVRTNQFYTNLAKERGIKAPERVMPYRLEAPDVIFGSSQQSPPPGTGATPTPSPTPPPGQLYRMGNKIYRIVPKK